MSTSEPVARATDQRLASQVKQPKLRQCQHRSQCIHDATWGVYRWEPGDTTVDLRKSIRVFCGGHKPRHTSPTSYLRNVRLAYE